MVRHLRILLITLFILVPFNSEAKGIFSIMHTEKFDWLPTESAHRRYPMTLIRGDLTLKDGSYLYVPAKFLIDNRWGEIGSTHVVGKTMKSLPAKLSATWFSFTENKFFAGDFVLPYDTILELCQTMISPKTGKTPNSYYIRFGFGPEGAVSVWVSAEGISVEVGNFRAAEVAMDWKTVLDNEEVSRADFIDQILHESLKPQELRDLNEHGVPPGISDHFSKQYRWNLEVIGQKNRMLWLKTLNGEEEYFDFVKTSNARTSRGLPQSLEVYWDDKTGRKFQAVVRFDEAEVTAAYKKLSGEKTDYPMQLKLEISDNPEVIHTSLNDGKYVILLGKTEVKTYSRR
ncbi:hypothetical protein GMLC_36030 [Geomonas limicola]|uniref:DUF2931 domain-containing protein n=2 Tax=Geomonas limicola TaxID=2740186 RepID=A0A6V8NDX5_9BACT|nr:hypothetical protein GMLC_36030 [Geomonas limicola]